MSKKTQENDISLRKTTYEEREYLKKLFKKLRKQGYTYKEVREIKIKALLEFRERVRLRDQENTDEVIEESLNDYFGVEDEEEENQNFYRT